MNRPARAVLPASLAAVAIIFMLGVGMAQTPVVPPPQPAAAMPTGPIDAADIAQLLKQFNVPGVSVAVIKDFKIDVTGR